MEAKDDPLAPGYGAAAMPRQFTLWSMIAFAIAVASSWVAVSSLLTTHMMFAGPIGAVWAPIVAGLASLIVAVGLAELSSAYPSSGGQYHYTYMISSPKYRNAAAFTVAWMNLFNYIFGCCAATIYPAQLTMQIAQVYNPGFTPERWQVWLVYIALIAAGTAVIIYFHGVIAKVEILLCWSSLLAFATWVVTLLAASEAKTSAKYVFTHWQNTSGWPDGFTFFLDIGQSLGIYSCIDVATHIAEEIYEPEKHVPRAMILATTIAIICNLIFTIAALFSSSSIAGVSAASFPIYEIGVQAIKSDGAVLFLLIWLLFTFYTTIPGLLLTAGRLMWAFSRDNGLPHSGFFNRISEKYEVPVEAHLVTCVCCMIYGLIYIGSDYGFNVILSTTIAAAFISYSVPQAILLLKGRDVLPPRYFKLGNIVGTAVNIFSVGLTLAYCVILSFPLTLPATATGMSYVSVVLVALLCFIALLWFLGGKRKTFSGPSIRLDIIEGREMKISDKYVTNVEIMKV